MTPAPTQIDEPRWSAVTAARYLDKSRSWIYEQAKNLTLPFVWVGGEMRFDPNVIRAYGRGETVGSAKVVTIGRKKREEAK